MRAFLALELSEAVRATLADLVTDLKRARVRVSWVKPDRMHLTLRFLGDVAEDNLSEGIACWREAFQPVSGFEMFIKGVGVFPNSRRPAVVWAGAAPAETLKVLNGIAEEGARNIGSPADNKPFHPHVTLARIRQSRGAGPLMDALDNHTDFEAGGCRVDKVTLFSSILTPKGPVYTRLEEFTLA